MKSPQDMTLFVILEVGVGKCIFSAKTGNAGTVESRMISRETL